jgi:hypothetical protein
MFKFKNKKKSLNLEQNIVNNLTSNAEVEKAVITYILLQSKENKITLAKKDTTTYIGFKNEQISDFLNEWFTILKLNQNGKLSKKMYEIFIKSQLDENNVSTNENKVDNEIDDYI